MYNIIFLFSRYVLTYYVSTEGLLEAIFLLLTQTVILRKHYLTSTGPCPGLHKNRFFCAKASYLLVKASIRQVGTYILVSKTS